MSATPPARDAASARHTPADRPRDIAELRLRRREASEAQRRRGLLRMDVGLGVLGAIVVLLATPGVAFAAIVALLVLIGCGVSVTIEHRRSRRGDRSRPRTRPRRGMRPRR